MAAACVTTPVTMGSILVKPIICSCAMFKEGAPKSPCSSFKSKAFLCTSSCQQFFSSIPHKKNRSDGVASRLRSSFITSWKAREHLGSHHFVWFSRGKKRESKSLGGTLVQASLLGVGAPEVLVIAVVALLVFGPKGLAEVARTLGKSLRAFQPTIRELQCRKFQEISSKHWRKKSVWTSYDPMTHNLNQSLHQMNSLSYFQTRMFRLKLELIQRKITARSQKSRLRLCHLFQKNNEKHGVLPPRSMEKSSTRMLLAGKTKCGMDRQQVTDHNKSRRPIMRLSSITRNAWVCGVERKLNFESHLSGAERNHWGINDAKSKKEECILRYCPY
ncbi:hypothetical protein O6H91_09G034400 [Diphasiastrum complanatum]|uniref:Uncharacterized protein n=1 Tax=Diphasiastrum complanatum TaxID=34168 RepID=A0ACC2CN70_DIPCM|nr:hypothetical protein O6H91_09G034400 [Diphasiastrum complanatum]